LQTQKTLENRLLATCQLVEAPADLDLIKEGQGADAFYFVYHGRVVAFQNASKPAATKVRLMLAKMKASRFSMSIN